jgi:hypothetical protein
MNSNNGDGGPIAGLLRLNFGPPLPFTLDPLLGYKQKNASGTYLTHFFVPTIKNNSI